MEISQSGIFAITLICSDLKASKAFYEQVFEKALVHEDAVSALYSFDTVYVNLLQESEAAGLFAPMEPGETNQRPRALLTVQVKSVDAEIKRLAKLTEATGLEIQMVGGPINRPWGIRTQNIADPDGNIWELSEQLT